MRKYFLLVPLVAALTAFTRPASSTEITLYGVVDGYVAVNIAGSQLKSGIQSGGAKPSLWGINFQFIAHIGNVLKESGT